MNKVLRNFLILAVVFFAGLFVFSNLTNHETRDLTTDMAQAALPIVYIQDNGKKINELHGYVDEMDAKSMRGTITPVSDTMVLPIEVDTYGCEVKSVSFEIRSLDTSRLVQTSEAGNIQTSEQGLTAELKIEDLLQPEQEYLLILKIQTETDSYCYYTRVIRETDSHIGECLDFVQSFHEMTMSADRQDELARYMEPSLDASNDNLHLVNINNSLFQASWGEFVGTEVTEPVASVMEMNDSYHVILLNYIMSSENESGAEEYYNVEEYYRVRYGTEKMFLLSFERTVEEIFRGDSSEIQENFIDLGIRSEEVDFKANETGSVLCFVQQGELWSYNMNADTLTQVFSFRSAEGMDVRENFNEHDIRIIRADEGGSIDFIVYGYMNRGDHEGQVGISVCHYDCVTNTVEERLFLPSAESYQVMKEEIGQMMYLSDAGDFYLTMGIQVYKVDLDTLEAQIFISDLADENYMSSDNGRYLAWTKENAFEATTMYLTDFETGQTREISDPDGRFIRPLGFLDTDCIYGLAKAQNVQAQDDIFAMNEVVIIDSASEDLTVLKNYDCGKAFVVDISVSEGNIYLNRAVKRDGMYTAISQDTIRNRDMQDEDLVYISQKTSERKQKEIILQLASPMKSNDPNRLISKQILAERSTVLELDRVLADAKYYVYAKGKVLMATTHITAAIACADENRGVVIGKDQSYVWKRAKSASHQIEVQDLGGSSRDAKAAAIMLNAASCQANVDALFGEGKTVYEALCAAAGDHTVFNLTGCTAEQVLYFVGNGMPVYAKLDGSAVLLTGYSETTVTLYHPSLGTSAKKSLSSVEESLENSGNVFYVIAD